MSAEYITVDRRLMIDCLPFVSPGDEDNGRERFFRRYDPKHQTK